MPAFCAKRGMVRSRAPATGQWWSRRCRWPPLVRFLAAQYSDRTSAAKIISRIATISTHTLESRPNRGVEDVVVVMFAPFRPGQSARDATSRRLGRGRTAGPPLPHGQRERRLGRMRKAPIENDARTSACDRRRLPRGGSSFDDRSPANRHEAARGSNRARRLVSETPNRSLRALSSSPQNRGGGGHDGRQSGCPESRHTGSARTSAGDQNVAGFHGRTVWRPL